MALPSSLRGSSSREHRVRLGAACAFGRLNRMQAEQNELITRIGPGTACGALMRSYWQPAALLAEFDPAHDAGMAVRPVKPVRLLGQDLVLFRDGGGGFGLLDRACPHRGADLAFGRLEPEGLRCPFHGWKFAADGTCLETPAEPAGSTPVHARAPARLSGEGAVGRGVRVARARGLGADRIAEARRVRGTGQPQLCLQGPVAMQLAAGVRGGHRPRTSVVPAPLPERRLARRRGHLRPASFVARARARSMANAGR